MLIRHSVAREEAVALRAVEAVAAAVAAAATLVVKQVELAKRILALSLGRSDGQNLRKAGETVLGGATRRERFGTSWVTFLRISSATWRTPMAHQPVLRRVEAELTQSGTKR